MADSQIAVKTLPAQTVAYALCTGSYQNVSPRLNRLFGWLKEQGLPMTGAPGGRFFGSPDEAAQGKTVWELYAPVADGTAERAPDGEQLGIKRLESRHAAVSLYLGPYSSTGNGYPSLMEWTAANGYTISGPAEEWWLDDDDDVAPENLRSEIAFPVQKR